MNNELEKEFQIEMVPEVTQRIVALSGKINQILAVKTSEITGLEDFITSLLASERADWLKSEIEKLEGEKINLSAKARGDDFVSQIAIKEVEKHEWSYNQALTSIITRYKEELLELENK